MNTRHTFRLSALTLAVFSLPAFAAPADEDTPFATAPLNLQDTSLTQKVTVSKEISTINKRSSIQRRFALVGQTECDAGVGRFVFNDRQA